MLIIAFKPGIPGIPKNFGTRITGLKLTQHLDFGTNILFVSKTKFIANLVSSRNFFHYSNSC
jgi:hypothetical protein